MKEIMIIDEIKTINGLLSYRAFEERTDKPASYGIELEYMQDGRACRKIFNDIADNKEYVLKMNSEFAENAVLPENIEEIAEDYICTVKA